ncbi:hypothetical protein EDF51_11126 [Curtobacterium sp. PhB25]|uniref:hypothetical protein n=1 Tax=Curtobacterium sp. PhB25 TaxID=2485205 RepID=UPI00106467B1|nr:hypothetical protein [Curtobacterium sp. PhB25]TDW64756.1 hypothetical protein EDF51_11126 [Curtobacterium sp. PhB25]
MAGGFSIGVAMDARAYEKGIRSGIIEPTEDAQDKLEELGKAGERAGDGLDRGLRDGGDQLDKLGKAGKDAGDDIEDGAKHGGRELDKLGRAGKEAGDDLEAGLRGAQKQTGKTADEYKAMTAKIEADMARIKAEGKGTFQEAGGATGEFKEEALANFSEVTSSFTGDMQSVTDLAQGTFGGLASLGGPASLVFGGIAVAVGLVGSALASSGEESDEFKEKIADLAQTRLGDLFGQYEDSGDALARGLRKWATDSESFGGSLLDLQKNATKAGLGVGDLTEAIGSQSVSKMRRLRTEVEDQIETLNRQAAALSDGTAKGRIAAKGAQEQAEAARAVKKQLDQNLEVNDTYEKSLRAVAKAQGQTVEQYQAQLEATKEYDEATQALADTMTSTLAEAAESTSEALDNSALNADKYISGLQQRTEAAQQYEANVQAIGERLPADLFNFVREQGPDFSEEIATYLSANDAQRARIQAGWKIAAQVEGDTSDLDAKTTAKGKERTKGPTSEVQGDTSDVDKKVAQKGKEKADGPTSKLQADTSDVDDAIRKLKGKRVDGPTIVYQVDTSAIDDANRRIATTPVTQTVNQRIGKAVA